MTRDDTIKILSVLRGAYPQFYRGITQKEAEDTVALWGEMFSDEPYPIVAAAVKAWIASDTKGFPPVIGQIKDKIRLISSPREMTEGEAWAQIQNALRNSTYGSAEEFAKLPPTLQRLVGSPSQLREWAQMDTETVQSVVSSNFQRSFRARASQEREWNALPGKVKDLALQLGAGFGEMPALPASSELETFEMREAAIKRLQEVQ